MQATRANVFGVFVNQEGNLGESSDAVLGKFKIDLLRAKQGFILRSQRCIRLSEDAYEVLRCQRLKFNPLKFVCRKNPGSLPSSKSTASCRDFFCRRISMG